MPAVWREHRDAHGCQHKDHEPPCDWCDHFKWSAIAAIVFGWPPILVKAWGALKQKVLDINMLMTLAVIGAICIEDYVEGGAVVFLFALSEWLEDRATEKARVAISAVIALKPEKAVLKSGASVPVEDVNKLALEL